MNDLRITVADNGFILRFDDPAIRAKNKTSDGYEDPSRERLYTTPEALTADLGKLLPLLKAEPPADADTYAEAIAEAFSTDE